MRRESERTARDDLDNDIHSALNGTVDHLTTADRDLFTSSDIYEMENAAQRLIALAVSLRHTNREAA